MQQLQLQFEGMASSWQPADVSATTQRTVRVLTAKARETVSPWITAWRQWAAQRSETFTTLCGSEGDVFTRGDVVKAHMYLAVVIILVGIGGAL